ncbi:MAG TPA: ABC transporter permease [Longimicrobiales bacterium]|nr:ABC transporter permease [Longimicrobiales bacterium]
MRNVWAVIRREYLQRVRSKWFIISTIGGPLFMVGLMVIPILTGSRAERASRNIALVDRTEVLQERLIPRLEEIGLTVTSEAWSEDVVPRLTQKVTDEELGGFLLLDDETLRSGTAVFYGTKTPSTLQRVTMRAAVSRTALEKILGDQGVDAESLMSGGELNVEMLSGEGAGFEDPQFMVAYLGSFFLYMMFLLYSVSVMRATLEEKTSRIVEVVISSMKPWHLMLGKILGVGAVGLTQMAVWFGSGAILAGAALPAIIASRPELATLANMKEFLPGAGLLGLFLIFFLFGYFIFAGLYAAVGATCNTDEEAQQAQFPVMLLVIVPILFVMQTIQSPNTTLSVSLSLFPFFSPILMFARVSIGAAPVWQVLLSFVLMGLTVVGVAWVAGRIYKVGILMAGKRPTVPELWRWVREA